MKSIFTLLFCSLITSANLFGMMEADSLAQQWKKGERLLVSDAIAMRAIGSPATLHARLKQLRDKEMITYVIETDGRKKYIEPTEGALKYFSQISHCMLEATKK